MGIRSTGVRGSAPGNHTPYISYPEVLVANLQLRAASKRSSSVQRPVVVAGREKIGVSIMVYTPSRYTAEPMFIKVTGHRRLPYRNTETDCAENTSHHLRILCGDGEMYLWENRIVPPSPGINEA